jgi:thiamine-monophosphate kinase
LQGRRIRLPVSLGLTAQEERTARRAIRRHFIPEPQLAVSRWLASRRRAAAIDVSDGLALDLHRLCRESGAGARINSESLSNQKGFGPLCRQLALPPVATILAGGEDYALLFALSPRVEPPPELQCRLIGHLDAGSDVYLSSQGRTEPLPAKGWDHFERQPGAD